MVQNGNELDPRYYPMPYGDPNLAAHIQNVLTRLDTIVDRFGHYDEREYNADEWDIGSDLITSGLTAGTTIQGYNQRRIGFKCRTLLAWNTSGHTFLIGGNLIPPTGGAQLVIRMIPAREALSVTVFTAGATAGELRLVMTEELISPTTLDPVAASGGSAVSITGPLDNGDASAAGGLLRGANYVYNGATWDRWREASGDAQTATGNPDVVGLIFNGATYDRWRETGSDAQTALGNPDVVNLLFNGATYDRMREVAGDAQAAAGIAAMLGMVWNGATYDRMREPTADALAVTGLLAAGNMGWNGATWDRLRTILTGVLQVSQVPNTTLGLSLLRLSSVSAATGTVKASAGSLRGFDVMNNNAAIRYLHIYNKASAPTLGTDTPVYTKELPIGAAANIAWGDGIPLGTGIAYAVTTDNVAIPAATGAAADIQGTIAYV